MIADFTGSFDDARELADRLAAEPGGVEHGLFPPELVSDVIVATGESVEIRAL